MAASFLVSESFSIGSIGFVEDRPDQNKSDTLIYAQSHGHKDCAAIQCPSKNNNSRKGAKVAKS